MRRATIANTLPDTSSSRRARARVTHLIGEVSSAFKATPRARLHWEHRTIATYDIIWVDTFTSTPLTGNACAVVIDARGLHAPAMQAIAREMNLAQTAFVFPSDQADFGVRYFMPTGEIPLAGHPTIAAVHALCEIGRIAADCPSVTMHMPAGIIPVALEREPDGTRYAMSQPAPQFLSIRKRGAMAKALGLVKADLLETVPPQVVSTGRAQLQIPLASLGALDRINIDRQLMFPATRDFLSVHVFARAEDEFALHARHFTDVGDVREDPFTGSATGGMAAYCARYGIVTAERYRVAQGMHVKRPGVADVSISGKSPSTTGRITVAGQAVTVLRAALSL